MPYLLIAKVVGVLALVALATWGVYRVKAAFAAEAELPKVQAQLAGVAKRADDLNKRLIYVDGQRVAYEKSQARWDALKGEVLDTLEAGLLHSPVRTNPACRPTLTDRKLFNDALRSLRGADSSRSESRVPGSPSPPH